MSVNGKVYDFESLKLLLPSGQITVIEELSYTAKKDIELIHNAQGNPVGFARKKFDGDFSMTISRAEYEILAASVENNGGILGCPSMDVVASYGNMEGETITDSLKVKFTSVEPDIKSEDGQKMKLSGKQVDIPRLNGKSVYDPKY